MKTQCLTSDRVNTLPQNIVDNILSLMPIKDAMRTSILSKQWRYRWKSTLVLAFNDNHLAEWDNSELEIYKLVNAILCVLLSHEGPLVTFEFVSGVLEIGSELDPIILYLSRMTSVKHLFLAFICGYKLPHSFFSLNGLEVLELVNCKFDPPLSFNGFPKLRKLSLHQGQIKAKKLLHFLSCCPLLEEVVLADLWAEENFEGADECTFAELLRCVPLVTTLKISKHYMKYLVVAPTPHMLSTPLDNLKILNLTLCLMEQDEIRCTLCLIRSSPNLERITFRMDANDKPRGQATPMNFFDQQNHSDLYLDHLEKLEIQMFSFSTLEVKFMKLIMAKAPVLKIGLLEIDNKVSNKVSVDEQLEMLRQPFPRASPSAKLLLKGQNLGYDNNVLC